MEDIITDPSIAKANSGAEFSAVESWTTPPHGYLKLNEDGAVNFDASAGGIGRLLNNDAGEVLLSFSCPIGLGPPVLAKILAITVFFPFHWSLSFRLLVECDCKSAVEWILDPPKSPLCSRVVTRITLL